MKDKMFSVVPGSEGSKGYYYSDSDREPCCIGHISVYDAQMPSFFRGAPCMGNNLAVEVRYALGSRER